MKTYLITYELAFDESSPYYTDLFNRIKAFQLWARPVKGIWLIKTNSTREQIMNYLKPALLFNDKILIIQVTNDWISLRLPENIVRWMRGGL